MGSLHRSGAKLSERPLRWLALADALAIGILWCVFGSTQELLAGARLVPTGIASVAISLPWCRGYPRAWSVADGLLLTHGIVVFVIGTVIGGSYFTAKSAI